MHTLVHRFRVLCPLGEMTGGVGLLERAMDVLGPMPNLEVTGVWPALQAAAGMAPPGPLLGGVPGSIDRATNAVHRRGGDFRLRETGVGLDEALDRESSAHDLVVLPRELAARANQLGVPVMLV